VALGERRRNPLKPRSTAEGAAALRAAGALERDPAVRCPDDLAADFLGGFNITTLAKHRLTRSLVVRRANVVLPGAYPYEIARCKFIDEVTLSEADAGLDELVLLGAGLDSRPYRLADRLGDYACSRSTTRRARPRSARGCAVCQSSRRATSASCPSISPATTSRASWREPDTTSEPRRSSSGRA
jgi:hypothetical protein